MPPRPLILLVALALLGHGVRLALVPAGDAAGAVEVLGRGPVRPASAVAHRDSIAALSRPLAQGERINLDRATVPEIARLPRVGIALAKRIAADRAARGPFGGLAGLDRVTGVGPGLLRALEPHVEFSAAPGRSGAEPQRGLGLTPGAPALSFSGALQWLNAANAIQLDSLPGIGPARAAAIVQYRERHGPFATIADLAGVPGINPALLQRLYDSGQVP